MTVNHDGDALVSCLHLLNFDVEFLQAEIPLLAALESSKIMYRVHDDLHVVGTINPRPNENIKVLGAAAEGLWW